MVLHDLPESNKVGSLSASEEINEFQVVHALITQSLQGANEPLLNANCDQKSDDIDLSNFSNNLLLTLCQTLNSSKSSNRKLLFSRSMRKLLSQRRKLIEDLTTTVSNTNPSHLAEEACCYATTQNMSCLMRYATVHKTSCTSEDTTDSDMRFANISSNVQTKVQQFEKQACATQSVTTGFIRTQGNAVAQGSKSASCEELCPGRTPHSPAYDPSTSKQALSHPSCKDIPKTNGSRCLKRVPSERYQKMRQKIQKLMEPKSEAGHEEEERISRKLHDETTFLKSIYIPTPAQRRQDFKSRPCLILRLPDHVLSLIFSLLDTRTLASVKCACNDFNFIVNHFDIRATDSCWTKDEKYLSDPCKQCRHLFVRGDMSMCQYHPKRYYSDLPYGRSYWMCCLKIEKSSPGCKIGCHNNNWRQ